VIAKREYKLLEAFSQDLQDQLEASKKDLDDIQNELVVSIQESQETQSKL
jgi:hypothetical protein